jgi:predicted permease
VAHDSKLAPIFENVAESTVACLITMVQGNVLALTLGHWIIASETGFAAGLVTSAALLLAKTRNRWIVSSVLGVCTAVVDYFMHPGGFGPVFLEAVVTGLGAAALCHLVGFVIALARRRRRTA